MDQPDRSRLRRLGTAAVTLGVLAVSAGAVVLGAQAIGRGAAAIAPGAVAEATAVRVVLPAREAGYRVERRFFGRIEAARRVDLAFEFGGRLARLDPEEGARVRAGTEIAALDGTALAAERAALVAERAAVRATLELAQLTAERQLALRDRGVASSQTGDAARLEAAAAEARLAAIDAQIAGVDVRIGKSVLTAPFDALLGARHVDPGQTVAAGQVLVTLHAPEAPQMRVGLPLGLSEGLAPGDPVRLDLGSGPVTGRVLHLRPDVDPATLTRSVLVALPVGTDAVFGGTGALVLEDTVPEPGFWLPVAALREGARGSWAVLLVEEGKARVDAVEVLHAAGDQVFVRAAFAPGTAVIAAAPDRVVPGQTVQPLE